MVKNQTISCNLFEGFPSLFCFSKFMNQHSRGTTLSLETKGNKKSIFTKCFVKAGSRKTLFDWDCFSGYRCIYIFGTDYSQQKFWEIYIGNRDKIWKIHEVFELSVNTIVFSFFLAWSSNFIISFSRWFNKLKTRTAGRQRQLWKCEILQFWTTCSRLITIYVEIFRF